MQSPVRSEDGIVTVSGRQPSDGMHPIGLQMQSLRKLAPLLQESGDPAWQGLQQDLQIMHKSDAGLHMDSQPLLKIIDRYRVWSQAHSSSIVQEQDEISQKTDDVWSKACRVIADLSKSASVVSTAAKQATLAEDLMQRLTDLETRLKQCKDAAAALEAEKAGRLRTEGAASEPASHDAG
ncbi:g5713 [Coccomyxa viridis]|uniref:G5713 protein n=1 Tax=Coccomyxa viridis TaxID=1274662 RepID=A0ABP1FW86_9CHLO